MKTNSHARSPAAVHQFKDVVINCLVDGLFKFLERLHLRNYVVAKHLRRKSVDDHISEVLGIGKNYAVGDLRLLLEQDKSVFSGRLAKAFPQYWRQPETNVLRLLEKHRGKEELLQIYVDHKALLDRHVVQMSVSDAEASRENTVQHDLSSDLLYVLAVIRRQRKRIVQELVVRQLLEQRKVRSVRGLNSLRNLLFRNSLVVVESVHQIRCYRLVRLHLRTLSQERALLQNSQEV